MRRKIGQLGYRIVKLIAVLLDTPLPHFVRGTALTA
jgi:hypothetical protein